ncbi:hypothetical protein LINPERHAP2_LOCUS5154 [Linum perenne]
MAQSFPNLEVQWLEASFVTHWADVLRPLLLILVSALLLERSSEGLKWVSMWLGRLASGKLLYRWTHRQLLNWSRVRRNRHQHASEVMAIRERLKRDWEVTIPHIYREGNYVADYLADIEHGFPLGTHLIDVSDCTLGYFLRHDCMGISEPIVIHC